MVHMNKLLKKAELIMFSVMDTGVFFSNKDDNSDGCMTKFWPRTAVTHVVKKNKQSKAMRKNFVYDTVYINEFYAIYVIL